MTPKPADYEVLQRPVWDPAPGTAYVWQCVKDKPLAMHRLSDRVLGGLYVAIQDGLIKPHDCDLNETDLVEGFQIRILRSKSNLGRGLLTPDEKAVVSIPVELTSKTIILELRGAGEMNAHLPSVLYDADLFQSTYPNWAEWRDNLIYRRGKNGTLVMSRFSKHKGILTESTPPDWPRGLTRDRLLASEASYRQRKLNLKTGLPDDTVEPKKEVVHVPLSFFSASKDPRHIAHTSATPSKVLSIEESIDERYGFEDRNRKKPSVVAGNVIVVTDSEDEINTSERPNKRKRGTLVDPELSETPNRQRSPSPAIAPIEVHKAAFQAAFRDKSVQRTELFHALLPYITVADAEEILLRCQRVAAVISESKFE
ncbi:hypothetical protein VF21_03446 [Pseudogymnoascus sp. 05NY08]|nr:hypothetical protein VF21_03446 [Pseudogymnoascus sp. 05NY08]